MADLKVTCIMCTYGRFQCVERSISMFINQTYENKELIIFNTASTPLELSDDLKRYEIKIINNQISYETKQPYKNIGEVRLDSLTHLEGDVYICWDDDDLYLPHHIKFNIDNLLKFGKKAFKPKKSYFSRNGGKTFHYAENNMEASILVFSEVVKEFGMYKETGSEHLKWLNWLRDHKEIIEDIDVTPFESYCFNWGDSFAPHKQSGNISDPNNFENHKNASRDFGDRPLKIVDVSQYYYNIWNFGRSPGLKLTLEKFVDFEKYEIKNKTKVMDKNIDLYSTHIEYLNFVLNFLKPRNVIEFGMGRYSTNALLKGCSGKLVSFEMQHIDWHVSMIKEIFGGSCNPCKEKWIPILNLDTHCYKEYQRYLNKDIDLVFVDGHQDTRPECINQFNNICETIITHDTEDNQYGWERVKLDSNYQKITFDKYPNWTTVWTKNNDLYNKLKELN